MKVAVLLQPFRDQVGRILASSLRDPASNGFWFLSAWVQRAGIDALASEITALRTRGGSTECVIGLDHSLATREGLERAIALMSDVYVFHDSGRRTLHPKVFVVEHPEHALAVVGSGNCTSGGLFSNFEAAVSLTLERRLGPDVELLQNLREYFDRFVKAQPSTRRLRTVADVDDLISNSGLMFATPSADRGGAADREMAGRIESYFGPPLADLPWAPRLANREMGAPLPAIAGAGTHVRVYESPSSMVEKAPAVTPARWMKKLTASDAQRKKRGHQRGSITLTKAGYNIDAQHYFREELFKGAGWRTQKTRTGERLQVVAVDFEVVFLGRPLGVVPLEVSHASNREAGQDNYTTLVHWGHLTRRVRRNNLEGKWLLIERRGDGSFGLELLDDPRPR